MNYQYLHSVVSGVYQDLPVVHPVPSVYSKDTAKYSFIIDAAEAQLPGGYCYAPVAAEEEGLPPLLTFSRVEQKRNSTSLCYFTQCAAWEWNRNLLLDDFDSILQTPFLSEKEIDRYAERDGSVRFGTDGRSLVGEEGLEIHPDAIRAILFGVAYRWSIGAAPVRIVVPKKDMGDYDGYVLRAVRTIYSYFTVGMKSFAGFSSFIRPGREQQYPFISLIFTPEEYADGSAIRLDGSTSGAYRRLCASQGKKLDGFLNYLAGLSDPAQRRGFLAMVSREAEFDGDNTMTSQLRPARYRSIGQGLYLLQQEGTPEELFGAWKEFAESGEADSLPDAVSDLVWRKIDGALNEENFSRILEQETRSYSTLQELLTALGGFQVLCHGRTELKRAAWDILHRRLEKLADPANPVGNFKSLKKEEPRLTALWDGPETEELLGKYEDACILKVREGVEKKLEEEAAKDIRAFREKGAGKILADTVKSLNTISCSEDKIEALNGELQEKAKSLIIQALRGELAVLREKNTDDVESAEAVLRETEKLIAVLPGQGASPDADELRSDAMDFREALVNKITAFRTGVDSVIREMTGKDYFSCLEIAGARDDELDDPGRETVRRELIRLRPRSYDEYIAKYNAYFRSGMNLSSVLSLSNKARKYLAEDIGELRALPISFPLSGDLAALSRKCRDIQEQTRFAGARSPMLIIDMGKKGTREYPVDMVERAASLSPREKDLENNDFISLFKLMICTASLRGRDLYQIHKVLAGTEHCNWKWFLAKLSTGGISDLPKEDLNDYLRSICAEQISDSGKTRDKQVVEVLADVSEERRLIEPFQSFLKKNSGKDEGPEGKIKKLKILSIILGAFTLLALAASIFLGIMNRDAGKENTLLTDSNTELQTQVEELQAEVERLEYELHPPLVEMPLPELPAQLVDPRTGKPFMYP